MYKIVASTTEPPFIRLLAEKLIKVVTEEYNAFLRACVPTGGEEKLGKAIRIQTEEQIRIVMGVMMAGQTKEAVNASATSSFNQEIHSFLMREKLRPIEKVVTEHIRNVDPSSSTSDSLMNDLFITVRDAVAKEAQNKVAEAMVRDSSFTNPKSMIDGVEKIAASVIKTFANFTEEEGTLLLKVAYELAEVFAFLLTTQCEGVATESLPYNGKYTVHLFQATGGRETPSESLRHLRIVQELACISLAKASMPGVGKDKSRVIPKIMHHHTTDDELQVYVIGDTNKLAYGNKLIAYGTIKEVTVINRRAKMELGAMFVHPDYHGNGFGQNVCATLMGRVLKNAPNLERADVSFETIHPTVISVFRSIFGKADPLKSVFDAAEKIAKILVDPKAPETKALEQAGLLTSEGDRLNCVSVFKYLYSQTEADIDASIVPVLKDVWTQRTISKDAMSKFKLKQDRFNATTGLSTDLVPLTDHVYLLATADGEKVPESLVGEGRTGADNPLFKDLKGSVIGVYDVPIDVPYFKRLVKGMQLIQLMEKVKKNLEEKKYETVRTDISSCIDWVLSLMAGFNGVTEAAFKEEVGKMDKENTCPDFLKNLQNHKLTDGELVWFKGTVLPIIISGIKSSSDQSVKKLRERFNPEDVSGYIDQFLDGQPSGAGSCRTAAHRQDSAGNRIGSRGSL